MINHLSILLIDDDEDEKIIFCEVLDSLHLQLQFTWKASCEKAIEWLNVESPDIIFLDLDMPATNGYESLEQLRKRSGLQKTPIFIYSNTVSSFIRNKALAGGATDAIPKLSGIRAMAQVIHHCFQKYLFSGNHLQST